MSIFQSITDFFQSIFNKNAPAVQAKLLHKKLEAMITSLSPALYKNGVMLPNFAEAVRILYTNTSVFLDVFSDTLGSSNAQKAQRYEAQLVVTGLSPQTQTLLSTLSYDERMKEFDDTKMTTSQIFDKQKRVLDKIISELSGAQFKKIDEAILNARAFIDFVKFNFLTIVQVFDPNYSSVNSTPHYRDVEIERLSTVFEDLYYVTSAVHINQSLGNVITALSELQLGEPISEEKKLSLTEKLKNIAYITNHVLSAEKLRRFIAFLKGDEKYVPKTASYSGSAKDDFEKILQARFFSDEGRMKTQMNDEYISGEVAKLFTDSTLLELKGYNADLNKDLLSTGITSFLWILPMQVLKTFLDIYFNDQVKALLNDIVIEGFFNSPTYKTEFSNDVYASIGAAETIKEFEKTFEDGQKNSANVIENYINEGKNNADFFRRLDTMVKMINAKANEILVEEANILNKVYKHIVDLVQDAKKPTSEIISNLKVLMTSSRNKDNTDLLERQYQKWDTFFKIMKNYVILNA